MVGTLRRLALLALAQPLTSRRFPLAHELHCFGWRKFGMRVGEVAQMHAASESGALSSPQIASSATSYAKNGTTGVEDS
jgi:hypothetical protein